MAAEPIAVVDANVLLNLATPVVDGRPESPSGADPLKAVLTAYEVHVPDAVMGEIADATGSDDLLSAAAEAVLLAAEHVTTCDVADGIDDPLDYGLDVGESRAVRLANELEADLFVTDEFNASNYLLVSMAVDDRETLFTTPHVLCRLAERGVLPAEYVRAALAYYCETKAWDGAYVDQLRARYL